ncbi:MAG: polysaccharide biosynthesis C-terminal domain-containing protein [Candidatus Baltobacteraceae bacterium]
MPRPTFANKVMYDGLYTFVMRILNVGCAAGLGIVTARFLGPSGKGLYALPSVEAGLVASAFGGLGAALSYFMLNRRAGSRLLRPALFTAAFFVLVGGVAIVPISMASGRSWAAIPAIISLPASAAINLATGYAVGIKRIRYATTLNVAVTLFTFTLMAAGLMLVSRNASVAIAVWIIATSVVGVIAIVAVVVHAKTLKGDEPVGTREFVKFSVKVGMVNLVSLLNYRADLYIIAIMTSAASLGMYTVAVSAAESLLVPTQVAALVTAPHIGSLEKQEAARLAARCVRNNLLIALLVCGVLSLFAEPLVRLLYGTAFLPVVTVLQVLLIGVFALSLGSPMSSYFTLKLGRPEVPLRLAGLSAAICIAASLFLVPAIGMLGAAVGSSVAYMAGQAAATLYFCRTTGIPARAVFLPTIGDWRTYASFVHTMLDDSRRLLAGRPGQ